jgi:redox-sensitive bicupin YhaK (pirin superfamily)
MTAKKIRQVVPAVALSEGAGVRVRRTIGTQGLRNYDPFLMLDHFSSDDPDQYIAGFPDHPHRGFITLTYMLDGHLLHQDSMGNRGDLRSGGIQWMKAASGVIHSEMPQQTDGLMRGFQLWINLPAREKMTDPVYQDFAAEYIPVVEDGGVRVKVISGSYRDRRGPIDDPNTGLLYLDVTLPAAGELVLGLDPVQQAFLYIYEGAAVIAGTTVAAHHLVALGDGDELGITAGAGGARMIVVAGKPLREPIVQYGPFVMSTEAEIHQAMDDYRQGNLVQKKARVVSG